jgi:hypothetical protein
MTVQATACGLSYNVVGTPRGRWYGATVSDHADGDDVPNVLTVRRSSTPGGNRWCAASSSSHWCSLSG